MGIKFLIQLTAFLFLNISLFAQKNQEWKIVKVINTFLQVGVADPVNINLETENKLYLGKTIFIGDSMLFFSEAIHSSNVYSDTVFFKEQRTFKVKDDEDATFRHPGDELGCEKSDCFVGKSFMKLLGSKDSFLTFYNLQSNGPGLIPYKLCYIKKGKKMGLLLNNAFLLLIIEKKE